MQLCEAQTLAARVVKLLWPHCARIQVAGSVRRKKADGIKDIEIVATPRIITRTEQINLLEYREVETSLLHRFALSSQCPLRWIKTGVPEIVPWTPKPDAKHLRAMLPESWVDPRLRSESPEGIKLDLFLATPRNWGAIMLIRTGSRDFNRAVMTHALKMNRPSHKGFFHEDGSPVDTREERDVFALLGLCPVEPARRRGFGDVRPIHPVNRRRP